MPCYHLSLKREFFGCLNKDIRCGLFIDAVNLDKNTARPYLHFVPDRVALAFAELHFGRLLGKRLIGEDAQSHTAGLAERADNHLARALYLV